jgi:aryl-phospho-beta-D-glucosidase BglC (GH1 family)
MKITTTCSLNALILKHYGGMFVTDATFQELQKAGMNGFDGPLSLGMAKVL